MARGTTWVTVSAAVAILAVAIAGVLVWLNLGSRRSGAPPRSIDQPSVGAPASPGAVEAPPATGPSTPPSPPVPSPPTAATARSLRSRFDEVDDALAELVSGHVAFTAPERMRFRESRTIALIASPAMEAEALGADLRERIGGADQIAVEQLQIAPLMEAHLAGAPAFEVAALTPARQPVSRGAPTEWRWTVQANAAGTHTLHLTMNAVLTLEGERFERSLSVLDRDIDVQITAARRIGAFLEDNWQWLGGTVVIPLAVWWWTTRRRGSRRSRSRANDG